MLINLNGSTPSQKKNRRSLVRHQQTSAHYVHKGNKVQSLLSALLFIYLQSIIKTQNNEQIRSEVLLKFSHKKTAPPIVSSFLTIGVQFKLFVLLILICRFPHGPHDETYDKGKHNRTNDRWNYSKICDYWSPVS